MTHGNVSLAEVHAVLDLLNGKQGVSAVIAGRELSPVKFGDTTLGQYEAFRNNLPDGVWEGVIQGNLRIVLSQPEQATVLKKDRPFVDNNGVFIRYPDRGVTAKVGAPNWNYHLVGPETKPASYVELLERLMYAFESENAFILSSELQDRVEAALELLRQDELFAGLVTGEHACPLVTVIPHTPKGDYGQIMYQKYIKAVERVYNHTFGDQEPKRTFNDYRKATLVEKVAIISETGHDWLVDMATQAGVPGLFFSNCTLGWSVLAQRQLIPTLTTQKFRFTMGGGFDTCAAWAGNIEVLARDNMTPGQDMPALQWQSADYSLCLWANDGDANFGIKGDLGDASGSYSGSVFLPV